MSKILKKIIDERQYQLNIGHSWRQDDKKVLGELSAIGATYAMYASLMEASGEFEDYKPSTEQIALLNLLYPYDIREFKPKDTVEENIVAANAMLMAEQERLDRKEEKENDKR